MDITITRFDIIILRGSDWLISLAVYFCSIAKRSETLYVRIEIKFHKRKSIFGRVIAMKTHTTKVDVAYIYFFIILKNLLRLYMPTQFSFWVYLTRCLFLLIARNANMYFT